MVTTDALKLLYKKLGGAADVENITAISDMVDLIEDVAGGGGGGASGLVVEITLDEIAGTMSMDKNYNEITTALNSGAIVQIKLAVSPGPTFNGIVYFQISTTMVGTDIQGNDVFGVQVYGVMPDSSEMSVYIFDADSPTDTLTTQV